MRSSRRAPSILLVAWLVASLGAIAGGCLASAAESDPMTALEHAVIEELNLARTQPAVYAQILTEFRKSMNGLYVIVDGKRVRTVEGPPAVDEAIAFFRSAQPLVPFTADARLSLAARDHARDLGTSGALAHAGADGSLPEDRIRRYGNPTSVGEILSTGPSQPRSIVIAFLVDDNVRDRGHRLAIMTPGYHLAGASIQPHASRLYTVCVVNFAGGFIAP